MAPTIIKFFSEKSKKIEKEKRVTKTLAGVIKKRRKKQKRKEKTLCNC